MLIMVDFLGLVLCGAVSITVSEYKARIDALGQHAFRIAMASSIALVGITYVLFLSSSLPASDYAKAINMIEDVNIVEMRSKKSVQLKHVHAFYEVLDNNPKELSRRQFYKLKAEHRNVMNAGK